MGGGSPASLSALGEVANRGFENTISVQSQPRYLAVQALGAGNRILRVSRVTAEPAHVAIFGWRAFVPSADGVGSIPVGCIKPRDCTLQATLSTRGSTVARSPNVHVAAGTGSLLRFRLSPSARAELGHRGRLTVQVSVRGYSGGTVRRDISLIGYQANGRGPRRSLTAPSSVQIVEPSGFVSPSGQGTILVACYSQTGCHAQLTLTAQGQQIAHTSPESLGADELERLPFTLTQAGRSLLTHNPGNQLPASVSLSNGSDTASGHIALIGYR
jgi:hypothetical protein